MKSVFIYNYRLVPYFSVQNNRWILFKQKLVEKVGDSDFIEIDLAVSTRPNMFVHIYRDYK